MTHQLLHAIFVASSLLPHAMADTPDLLPPVDSLANTLEAPPPAPLESARPHRPSTRSELFRLRREQGIAENEAARAGNDAPFWAKSLSGVEAATALGFATGGAGTTRRELMLARKLEAMADPEAGVPGVLVTSLARDYKDPGFDYVREPAVSTRSTLRAKRRQENVEELTKQGARDHVDMEARVQQRIDASIQRMLSIPPGKTRSQLMQSRRDDRVAEAETSVPKIDPNVPRYSQQPAGFWTLEPAQPQQDGFLTETAQSQLNVAQPAGLPPGAEAPAPAPGATAADANALFAAEAAAANLARVHASAVRSARSLEQLQTNRRWWARPAGYPRVLEPSAAARMSVEPYKPAEFSLKTKLSSGPKKYQRGYPPGADKALANKVTDDPAPPRYTRAERGGPPQIPKFTNQTFGFVPPEERIANGDVPASDGIKFTEPLYSSFTKDGIFPPEEHFRYNYRPATVAGGAYGARAGGAFGGTGPAGAFADAAARDAAAGGGRPGTSTLRMQTLIGTPKATSGRGASRLGVRSGGFQLFELERVLAD